MALIHSVRAAKLTNTPAFMKESGSVETGLSDHKLVYTVLDSKLIRPKAAVIKKRSFKYFDQTAFLEDLNRVPFSTAYVFDDPDDVYYHIIQEALIGPIEVYNCCYPASYEGKKQAQEKIQHNETR